MLNAVYRRKFGYVQQTVKIRSRSLNDTDVAEIMS